MIDVGILWSAVVWLASIVACIGAIWLALNRPSSPYAYVAMSPAAVVLSISVWRDGNMPMLLQQVVFTGINLVGIYCWVLRPARWRRGDLNAHHGVGPLSPRRSIATVHARGEAASRGTAGYVAPEDQ